VLRSVGTLTLALIVLGCQPTPSSTPATPSASPAQATEAGAGWTPIVLPATGEAWSAAGVIADSKGFVVFGGIAGHPAAWTSRDGTQWQPVALPPAPGFPFGFPTKAAASADATVLLGGGSTSRCAHPAGETLWRRAAGGDAWEGVPFDERLFCAGGLSEIAATEHVFAVVGMGTGDQPFAWQSADGLAWRDASQGLPANTPPSLMAAFDGGFIELGRGERTDVRTSIDGTKWTSAEGPPVPPAFNGNGTGMSPGVLISTTAGVLAVYEPDGDGGRSAWRRGSDGSWSRSSMTGFEPGDVIAGGVGIGANAYLFIRRGNSAALAISPDLDSWALVEAPPVGALAGLASFGGRTVLVASTPDLGSGEDRSGVFVLDGVLGGG
jgi:hypothetical protein